MKRFVLLAIVLPISITIVLAVLSVGIIFGAVYLMPVSAEPDPPSTFDACVMTEKLVKQQLKAPATADFPPCREADIAQQSASAFVVSSYVDSENSFGANIRTYYTAHVSMGSDGTWHLKSMEMLD